MQRFIGSFVVLVAVLLAGFAYLTQPQSIVVDELPQHEPDPIAGERIFWAGGCASCHASPVDGKRARSDDKLRLGGGVELETPFGTFRGPNISPHPEDGIGNWPMLQFVNAMQRGVRPDDRHYYPAFPYTSYARMRTEDVMDLRAFLATLPVVEGRPGDHKIPFPWSVRRGIGLWKRRYLDTTPVAGIDRSVAAVARGRDLVEGAGHCGECHTPRDRFGGFKNERWLGGAASLETDGRVPNITPAGKNLSDWSAADITYYLETGFTPDFDTVGSTMVAVQENMARLSSTDREAIAAYLMAIPPVADGPAGPP